MLKRIFFIVVFTFAFISAKAQFTIDQDTLYVQGFAGTSSSSFVDLSAEAHILGTSSGTELIKWTRITNQLPDPKWSSAVCDIVACKAPTVDADSFMLDSGEKGFLSFHFYPVNVKGCGKMVIRFSRASVPLEYADVVIFVCAWKPVGITRLYSSVTTSVPNPAQNSVTISNDQIEQGKIEVYNAIGQVVLCLDYNNNMIVDISDFTSGIYTFKIFDESHTSFSKIIKE